MRGVERVCERPREPAQRIGERWQVLVARRQKSAKLARRDPAIDRAGGVVVAAAALVDRSDGTAELGVPFYPLIRLSVPTYAADALPPELADIPAIKPGSRTV